MKKYIKISFLYAVLAMASGVFYREFTKFNDFTAKTALSVTHLHLFVLGTIALLIIGLLAERSNLEAVKTFRPAMIVYHIGLPFMVAMFWIRPQPSCRPCRFGCCRDRTCPDGNGHCVVVCQFDESGIPEAINTCLQQSESGWIAPNQKVASVRSDWYARAI